MFTDLKMSGARRAGGYHQATQNRNVTAGEVRWPPSHARSAESSPRAPSPEKIFSYEHSVLHADCSGNAWRVAALLTCHSLRLTTVNAHMVCYVADMTENRGCEERGPMPSTLHKNNGTIKPPKQRVSALWTRLLQTQNPTIHVQRTPQRRWKQPRRVDGPMHCLRRGESKGGRVATVHHVHHSPPSLTIHSTDTVPGAQPLVVWNAFSFYVAMQGCACYASSDPASARRSSVEPHCNVQKTR